MATHKTFSGAFKALYKRMESVQRDLPSVLANEGTKFWLGNFDKEGFDDGGVKSWKVPERRIPGTSSYKYPKSKGLSRRIKKTLIGTGKLRRAVNNSVKEKTFKRIVWRVGSEVPYAARHNEGLNKMPKREFMGESKTLNKRFKQRIIGAYKKAFS